MSHPVLIVLTILIFSWLLQPIAAISETFLENLSSPSAPEISLLESVPDSGNTQSLPKSVVSSLTLVNLWEMNRILCKQEIGQVYMVAHPQMLEWILGTAL